MTLVLLGGLVAASCTSSQSSAGGPASDGASPPSAAVSAPAARTVDVEAAVAAFLDAPSTDRAAAVVELMGSTSDTRWVPWLVDLLRVQISSRVSSRIGEVLESLTGIPATSRIPNMIEYGSWAQNRRLDGGEGYVEFKATLYERIDEDFGPLLRSVADPVELAAIQWGGVALGGIPELNDPARVPAGQADWMIDDEVVLGVVANGEAVAYPLRILARHELANDTVGGEDLAIVYCTLCRSALVFERNVAGQRLDFLTSGLLLNSNKIMYDVQTGSLWHHLRGLAIGGDLIGTELTVRAVNHLRWSDWVAEHPDSEVLELPTPIYFDDPERPPIGYDYTPGEAYRSYYENPEVWFPVFDTPPTFAIKTEVAGIERNGDSVAFDVEAFNEIGETDRIEVGGDLLTIEPTGAGVRVFDAEGNRVLHEQSFWFAWYSNHPDTRSLDY